MRTSPSPPSSGQLYAAKVIRLLDNIKASLTVVPQTPCPEGSVVLHQLYRTCERIFGGYASRTDRYRRASRIPSRASYLCTFSQLSRSRQGCHCCELLCSRILEHRKPSSTDSIWIFTGGMHIYVHVRGAGVDVSELWSRRFSVHVALLQIVQYKGKFYL